MLAAWATGTEGNLLQLWSRTNFKLTLDESMNKRQWSGLYLWPRTSITEQTLLQNTTPSSWENKSLNSSWRPRWKHTLVSWRRRFQPFNMEPKSSACFFWQVQIADDIIQVALSQQMQFIGKKIGFCKFWVKIHILVSLAYIFITVTHCHSVKSVSDREILGKCLNSASNNTVIPRLTSDHANEFFG